MTAIDLKARDFVVRKSNLKDATITASALPATPAPGQVLLAIDKFALTANNITYAAFGDTMQYWNFFPAAAGFGRIPVWGFADVVTSSCEGVAPGERIYGYFPMSTYVVLEPQRVNGQVPALPVHFFDVGVTKSQRYPYSHGEPLKGLEGRA